MIVLSTAKFALNVAPLLLSRVFSSSSSGCCSPTSTGIAHARSCSTRLHYSPRPQSDGRDIYCSRVDTKDEKEVVLYSSSNTNDSDEGAMNSNKVSSKAWLVLFLLSFTFISNQWCRQIIYYLVDFSSDADAFRHMNVDLNFDKDIYSKISSVAFTAVFALGSFFAGSLSDKFNRKNIIVVATLVWSVATAAESLVRENYLGLVPLRALLGISQSAFNPAAYTLLADIFPKHMLGVVNGIFGSGIYLGGALASLSILLDKNIGWRNTVNVLGAVGTAIALLVYLFAEDERQAIVVTPPTSSSSSILNNENENTTKNVGDSFQDILVSLKEVVKDGDVRLLYIASALRFCAGFSIGIWKAPFIFLKFPGSEDQFASANAFIIGGCGLASSLLGGYLSDLLSAPKKNDVKPISRLWIPAIGSLLAVPLFAGFTLTDQPSVAALLLFFEYLVAECWAGPTLASLYGLVPSTKRGTAQGLFSVVTAIGNLGPVIIGSLSSAATMTAYGGLSSYSLENSLLYVVCLSYLLCGILFTKAALNDEKRIKDASNKFL